MTYALGEVVASTTVPAGTNVLVTGPPLTGKRRVYREILERGMDEGEGAIVISTRDTADRILRQFGVPAEGDDRPLGVVDCVTEHVGRSQSETDQVRYAASPSDMTGMGIKFAELIEYVQCERGCRRNRVALDSVTTLLQYSSLQTVFQFLHAVTTRVAEVDAVGVAVVESTVHDEETMATIRELFDGVVETRLDGTTTTVDLPGVDGEREVAES